MSFAPGRQFAHFRILRPLGAGGMGEVYLAEDTKLKRNVALKFLPDNVVADPERLKRLRREAEALAAINHPHIVTLHSLEEAGGRHFFAMEFVEGQSLDRLVVPGGVALRQLIQLGIALADALSAAHGRGIVHRDLKPGNVMVTPDGRVKVLDFGLAKTTMGWGGGGSENTTSTLTEIGALLGTLPYMSPEQLLGKAIDHRTDLFALGVVLYELATGSRPFRGESQAALVSSILRDEPSPLNDVRGELPGHLGRIIVHCLAKDPEERTQSANDVRNELHELQKEIDSGDTRELPSGSVPSIGSTPANAAGGEVATISSGIQPARRRPWRRMAGIGFLAVVVSVWVISRMGRPNGSTGEHGSSISFQSPGGAFSQPVDLASVAVLPFVNMSDDASVEYFSDGVAEELLNTLARIPGLRVTGRTSSFAFKGKPDDLRSIGQKLNVGAILEGSVRKAGRRVRITAQLVNAADGFHLWSQTYDKVLDDIFQVQDEIARAVATALEEKLVLDEKQTPVRAPNAEAYNAILQGDYFGDRGGKEGAERAIAYYRQAVSIDPGYAVAWARLAQALASAASFGFIPLSDFEQARGAAAQALALDDDLAEAHAAMGYIKGERDWDWVGSDRDYARALVLAPGNSDVLHGAAFQAGCMGRLNEALALAQRAAVIDPLSVGNYIHGVARWAWYLGRFHEAEAALRKAMELQPENGRVPYALGLVFLALGRPEDAIAETQRAAEPWFRAQGAALAYHAMGEGEKSRVALEGLIEEYGRDGAFQIAEVYAFRGEVDQAFAWLERAYDQRDTGLHRMKGDPLLKNLEGDARYPVFLKKMGLPL